MSTIHEKTQQALLARLAQVADTLHLQPIHTEELVSLLREARAALTAEPPAQPIATAPYASALAQVTAAWVPFSKRLAIAEKVGTVVDAQSNEIVREVVQYVVQKNDAPPQVPDAQQRPAFSSALRGLVESLSRTPSPEELRFAAHEQIGRASCRERV